MEVHIGVVHTAKEISYETDGDAASVIDAIEAAVAAGKPFVWLEDGKGRMIGVPSDKIGYVEVVVDDASRKMGFGR